MLDNISVKSTRKSSNKVKNNKGTFNSENKRSSRQTSNNGNTVSFLKTSNKVKGQKGKYKSKGTKLTRHKDGSCTMSTNKVRGEKGKYKTKSISKSACDKKSRNLTRKHSKK
jgi:hypothetical protein|tara:strand:- start:832 stop:1167 length:336 start_codon:yes stop_codon:yes gene_type:complete